MMKGFIQALSFLTVIRIRTGGEYRPAAMIPYFAPAGLAIGAGLWAVSHVTDGFFLRPVLMLVYLAAVTGALHLDGFIDTADALFSHRSRERKLEIMKDPHAGSMGIVAVALLLLAKWSAFSQIGGIWLIAVIPAYARFAAVIGMLALPYARKEGLGKMFAEGAGKAALLQIIPFMIAVFWFCGLSFFLWFHFVFIICVLLVLFFYRFSLGGITGDLMGAMIEFIEAALFIFAAL
ncbi:adenosylcobinamide-GDP ribazoletransferase [Geovibrio thiophilus]|uniref:Adenosylcobinamide-GDP ribazoletransferase n=1 Tax=Geovibrio thiophilus TaxID=139438 RepID=A0A410JZ59_9BACT|nr:adenosylcobinamide-GDP ribazoletransferase [Geovibrio thiophilus]QAR33457.1 adenosylcobinamide-GDP ribazoletransferase [Geovibrio thiophilus]